MTSPDTQLNIRFIKGVGEKRAALFEKIGVSTAMQLLRLIPRSYIDRTRVLKIKDAPLNEVSAIAAQICSPVTKSRVKGGMLVFKFRVTDGETDLSVTLFNRKYFAEKLKEGDKFILFGRVTGTLFIKEMLSPEMDYQNDRNIKGEIIPVYPLTGGLTQSVVRNSVKNAFEALLDKISEPLPDDLISKHSLLHLSEALYIIHFPKTFGDIEMAKRRLVFEEFLIFSLGLLKLKTRNRGSTGHILRDFDLAPFVNSLPYKLTNAQLRVIAECKNDMVKKVPMSRLVQGDVGSGKTAVAAALCYFNSKNKYQTAFMAPTEILAVQHYNFLSPLMSMHGIKTALLTGSTKAKEKKEITDKLKSGEIDVIIGTHTLIENYLAFKALSLVITDEQHRFGVRQRALLSSKGSNPHILVMSATPIPRTLGLILYGDLDISIIDELPPGRKRVSTFLCDESYRERLLGFIEKESRNGKQTYIVCPLVEESDKNELKAVDKYFESIKKRLNGIPCGFIHGRLKASEKEEIMKEFTENKIKVLVATTVIEVGVDVPNATLMVIENAERFGLSQLHQLRGRVGRGKDKAYCILMSEVKSGQTQNRLKILTETNDGFIISEKDLQLRGPGDFFGQKQHGLLMLKTGSIYSDMEILNAAKTAAEEIYPLLIAKKDIFLELIKTVNSSFSEVGITVFN